METIHAICGRTLQSIEGRLAQVSEALRVETAREHGQPTLKPATAWSAHEAKLLKNLKTMIQATQAEATRLGIPRE